MVGFARCWMMFAVDGVRLAAFFAAGFGVGIISGLLMVDPMRHGRCHADETATVGYTCVDSIGNVEVGEIHYMECSECGRTYEHVNGDYPYCPHCGRKVVNYEP